jgi:hypothetical protein
MTFQFFLLNMAESRGNCVYSLYIHISEFILASCEIYDCYIFDGSVRGSYECSYCYCAVKLFFPRLLVSPEVCIPPDVLAHTYLESSPTKHRAFIDQCGVV